MGDLVQPSSAICGGSEEEMTSLLPHPSLPVVGGRTGPEVMTVGELALAPALVAALRTAGPVPHLLT